MAKPIPRCVQLPPRCECYCSAVPKPARPRRGMARPRADLLALVPLNWRVLFAVVPPRRKSGFQRGCAFAANPSGKSQQAAPSTRNFWSTSCRYQQARQVAFYKLTPGRRPAPAATEFSRPTQKPSEMYSVRHGASSMRTFKVTLISPTDQTSPPWPHRERPPKMDF